jgi:hypothetical protein
MKTHELSLKNTSSVVATVCGIEGPFDEDAICAFEVAPTCKSCLRHGRHKPTPVVPSIHLNGSGAKNLTEQYEEAIETVSDAIDALPVPHGRDYYVQEDGSFERAREQFEEQVAQLNTVLEELKTIYRGIRRQERAAS